MPKDYVPVNDDQLKTWLTNFVAILGVNAGTVGLVSADLTPIDTATGNFVAGLEAYQAKQNEMTAASLYKKTTRTDAIDILRPLVRRVNNHPGMTDQLRGLLGLPPRGESLRSNMSTGPEVPGIFVETALGQVTVHFGTDPQNERINGKPAWARGCNIYRKKAGEDEYSLMAFDTASPYVDEIFGAGAEYTYAVRYRGTKSSDIGAQSAEVTIAARGMIAA